MKRGLSRKNFLSKTGIILASTPFIASSGFPNILLPKKKEKLGVALVGLGSYSNGQLAPALQLTEHCELKGIVTGTPLKIPVWQDRYNIPDSNVYNYQTMHEIANNDDIDIVYIVLPTGLHTKYSIIGAEAGKHVWCEKPMAKTVAECQAIINAVTQNKVQLTIGYRMQHEPNTKTIIGYTKSKKFGAVKEVNTGAGYNGGHQKGNWRASAELGGGAMYDMGVYPLNAARYSTQEEPIAVSGIQSSQRKEMYDEVDETTEFKLWFPSGAIANGATSFGKSMGNLEVTCENGWYKLQPFQSYRGVRGEVSDGTLLPADPDNQQARQMDNDALAIKENSKPIVPGEEGLRDIAIIEAIQESSKKGGIKIQL
ncbi:MAG: Gfo/Idh/MocA family oxidoreductase [Balneolaceae bacterium]